MDIKKLKANQKNNGLLIVIAVVLLILILLAAFFLTTDNLFDSEDSPKITPRSIEEIKKDQELYKNQTQDYEVEDPLGGNISLIYEQTPYSGEHFSLIYSEDDNYFYYHIDPINPDLGNAELDEFLMKYGIPDRSLFEGLFESMEPFPTSAATNPEP